MALDEDPVVVMAALTYIYTDKVRVDALLVPQLGMALKFSRIQPASSFMKSETTQLSQQPSWHELFNCIIFSKPSSDGSDLSLDQVHHGHSLLLTEYHLHLIGLVCPMHRKGM